jgi:hypothetical protein
VFRATGARVAVRDFLLRSSGATFEVTAAGPARVEVHPPDGRTRARNVPAGRTEVRL